MLNLPFRYYGTGNGNLISITLKNGDIYYDENYIIKKLTKNKVDLTKVFLFKSIIYLESLINNNILSLNDIVLIEDKDRIIYYKNQMYHNDNDYAIKYKTSFGYNTYWINDKRLTKDQFINIRSEKLKRIIEND